MPEDLTAVESMLLTLLIAPDVCVHPSDLCAEGWYQLAHIAHEHLIGGALYSRLRDIPRSEISLEILDGLRVTAIKTALNNAHMIAEVREIASLFERNGIDVILLKGAHLITAVYESLAQRSMADIDLLVRPESLGKARQLMEEQGYSVAVGTPANPEPKHHLPRFFRTLSMPVEVHHALTRPDDPFTVNVDALWERAVPVSLGESKLLGLATEDLLLHLCVHAAAHHALNVPLRSLFDISTLINKRDIEWDQVMMHSREWQVRKHVFWALALSCRMFEAEVPEAVLSALRPPQFSEERLRSVCVCMVRSRRLPRSIERAVEAAGAWKGLHECAAWLPYLCQGLRNRISGKSRSGGARQPRGGKSSLLQQTIIECLHRRKHSRIIWELELSRCD